MPRGRKKSEQVDKQGWGADGARVNTISQSGESESKVIAPEPAAPEPIVLPAADEALSVLSALAYQNDRVALAKKRWEESAATTKARKGTWEMESEELSRMLTEATHAKPLPLFDAAQSEQDLLRMEAAIDASRQEGVQEAAGEALSVESMSSEESGENAAPTPVSAPAQAAPEAVESF